MRRALLVLALCGTATGVGACGGDDGDDEAGTIPVRGQEYAFVMPDSVEGPVVTFQYSNPGGELHEYALSRLGEGHTLEDVVAELERAERTGEDPRFSWLHDVGGVPLLSPGEEIDVTRELRSGSYVFLCFVPSPKGVQHYKLGMRKEFEVEGDSGRELPDAEATIAARDDGFDVPNLRPGSNLIELRNDASAPREFSLVRLQPGKDEADVEAALRSGRPPPIAFVGGQQSLPPGGSVLVEVRLEADVTYFVTDEENGLRQQFIPR